MELFHSWTLPALITAGVALPVWAAANPEREAYVGAMCM